MWGWTEPVTSSAAGRAPAGVRPFEFVRLIESGDEVIVTYQMTKADGHRGRNTEVLTFRREEICRTEVYFGWELR